VKRDALTSELPDSFDALLRAAADVSDVPLSDPLMLESLAQDATLGSGRFRICRLIGQGGMGAVYEAEDRDSRTRVALKVLNRVEPKRIKRFKDEFRILANTVHPRLVRLRDLFMEDGVWFFTMDLIEGATFSAHLACVGPVGSAARESELRRLLSQLVEGVAAIHATGHLHRDLKPANVLVARDGGVVIVDFGLVGDLSSTGTAEGLPVVGTASHMAPEQARGEPATAASDWYAVGTIVYEALTGRAPIDGDSSEVLLRKRRAEVPRLFGDRGSWPEDLVELCRALLAPEPEKRPPSASIVGRLGSSGTPPPIGAEPGFVGRLPELATLDAAFDQVKDCALVVCRVAGAPGIGKTALVREFLRRAARERHAVVLSGRCYEREATPFKLLDGIVDALCEAIERHVSRARDALSPLAALFLGLPAASEPGAARSMTEAEARSRAVHAFRTGLSELASLGPVILHIDDVQWCDTDGVGLLDEVLEAPAPRALVILTHRDEVTDPLLALWRARFLAHTAVVELKLDGLSKPDLEAIARAMAGRDHTLDTDAIARESGGSPYFAAEMIRQALEQKASGTAVEPGATLTLEHTILSRYRNLWGPARRILEALSVCEGPTSLPLLEAATSIDDIDRAIAVLRSASFVRTRALRDGPNVEPYHDRVREEVQRALPDSERRALHRDFARAFVTLAPEAWESLLHHFEGAGDRVNAALYARRSAERASQSQAFEQAAALFRRALELGAWPADEERKLYERRADALAMCGHYAEAAEAYDHAAAGNTSADRVRLEMLAATQVLCSGDIRIGIARLTESIGYLGVSFPDAGDEPARSAACILQALIESKQTSYREEASIDPEQLLRIDACWWAANGLNAAYQHAGPFLAAVHLLEAVRAGEPMRIARGAYSVAGNTAALQEDDLVPIIQALMQVGDAAAAHAPSPNVHFWRENALALQHHFAFDVDGTAAHAAAAFDHASSGGHGLEGEMARLSVAEMLALHARFEHPAELSRSEIWRRDALRRRDRTLVALTLTTDSRWWLTDTPELYRDDLKAVLAELLHTSGEDHVVTWVVNAVLAWVERYLGLAGEAFARAARVLELARASPFFWRPPRVRVTFVTEYVASAIAHAEASGCALPANVEGVLAEFPVQASGVVYLFRAGIAHLGGDRNEALRLAERAEAEPGLERTRVVSWSARYFRGRLLGGTAGRALARERLDAMRAMGCRNPERFFASWYPGFRNAL